MPRPVRSAWQAKGIELWDVKSLYSLEVRLDLLRHLGSSSASPERRINLLKQTLGAAGWLHGELYYAKKPRRSQTKAAITPIAIAAKTLLAMLANLDHRSRELIEQAADMDAVNNTRIGGETPRMLLSYPVDGGMERRQSFIGHERLSTAARAIENLERWGRAAPSLDQDRVESKTIRAKAIRSTIEDLQLVWKGAWAGRERCDPKLSFFLPYVQMVLNPVLAEDGKSEDLQRATEDVLHGSSEVTSTG